MTGAKTHVTFYPSLFRLEGQIGWIEAAFPRESCIWEENFGNFMHRLGGVDGADIGFGAVVVINGAATPTPDLRVLNDDLRSFRWVLLVVQGDEGSGFHLEWLNHPHLSIWVYNPKPGKHDKYHRLPSGPIKDIAEFVPQLQTTEKTLDWFFSGSKRDIKWDAAIQALPKGLFYATHLGHEGYIKHLAMSKMVPCRPTFATPETCRIYDALEVGCIPIVGIFPAEAQCTQCRHRDDHPHLHKWWEEYNYDWPHYWEYTLGESAPFPVVYGPEELAKTVQNVLHDWPDNMRRLSLWWTGYKAKLIESLRAEVQRLQS